MTSPRRPSRLGSICSPLCYPFVFRRHHHTSTAPDFEPRTSYVYFGREHYRYQNVNAGALQQEFRYSTEPQLQVRMLRVAVGDGRPNIRLMSSLTDIILAPSFQSPSFQSPAFSCRLADAKPNSVCSDFIFGLIPIKCFGSDQRSQTYLPSSGLAPTYVDPHYNYS
jgi:hypothetical protein